MTDPQKHAIDSGAMDADLFQPANPIIANPITACRGCGSALLSEVFSLGDICLNDFPRPMDPDPPKVPLTLMLCKQCALVQLQHTTNPDLLFKEFWYRSGVTETMRLAMADVVSAAVSKIVLNAGDVVVDIGSNDSTLLRAWDADLRRVGFEPAINLMKEARQGDIEVVNDYFSAKAYQALNVIRPAKVVTCCACFYDVDKPGDFLQDVKEVLARDGLFILQLSYLPDMLAKLDFPSICHEHLCYYSLTSLSALLKENGFFVYDAEHNDVNGGSIRVYCGQEMCPPLSDVTQMLNEEKRLRLQDETPYREFGSRVEMNKANVRDALEKLRKGGKVALLGASTKIQVALQYWGLDQTWLCAASERDQKKWDRETVGTRIPIVSEKEARKMARTMLVGPWHFQDEIVKREADWLQKGGRLVFPLPTVEIVTK